MVKLCGWCQVESDLELLFPKYIPAAERMLLFIVSWMAWSWIKMFGIQIPFWRPFVRFHEGQEPVCIVPLRRMAKRLGAEKSFPEADDWRCSFEQSDSPTIRAAWKSGLFHRNGKNLLLQSSYRMVNGMVDKECGNSSPKGRHLCRKTVPIISFSPVSWLFRIFSLWLLIINVNHTFNMRQLFIPVQLVL